MPEDQAPFGEPHEESATAALQRIQQEASERRELIEHWERLSAQKRQLVLLLVREMTAGDRL